MENYTFQSQNLRKKDFMWHRINQNVDDFLEYRILESLLRADTE